MFSQDMFKNVAYTRLFPYVPQINFSTYNGDVF